jgi:hypothetical protein
MFMFVVTMLGAENMKEGLSLMSRMQVLNRNRRGQNKSRSGEAYPSQCRNIMRPQRN